MYWLYSPTRLWPHSKLFPWQPLKTTMMHIALYTIFWRYFCKFLNIYCKFVMIRWCCNRRCTFMMFFRHTLTAIAHIILGNHSKQSLRTLYFDYNLALYLPFFNILCKYIMKYILVYISTLLSCNNIIKLYYILHLIHAETYPYAI